MPWQFNPFSGTLDNVNAAETAASILAKLITVDGAGSGLDADLLDGNSSAYFQTALKIDTEANILALPASSGAFAYGTDTQFFYIADGTDWRRASLKFYTDSANPDMGYEQNNSKDGYDKDWITDKTLYNVLLSGNTRTENGAIRIDTTQNPDTLEIYLRSQWNTIIYDLTTTNSDFRHTPLDNQVYIWSGMSVTNGFNNRPIINEYKVSMGIYPAPRILHGGTF